MIYLMPFLGYTFSLYIGTLTQYHHHGWKVWKKLYFSTFEYRAKIEKLLLFEKVFHFFFFYSTYTENYNIFGDGEKRKIISLKNLYDV